MTSSYKLLRQLNFQPELDDSILPQNSQRKEKLYLSMNRLVGRVFANGRRSGLNPGSPHTKDFKMVLDAFSLNPQQYKVRIQGKVVQSRERISALPYTLV